VSPVDRAIFAGLMDGTIAKLSRTVVSRAGRLLYRDAQGWSAFTLGCLLCAAARPGVRDVAAYARVVMKGSGPSDAFTEKAAQFIREAEREVADAEAARPA
jgi:hypothetical protein